MEDSVSVLIACRDGDHTFPVNLHLDYVQRPLQRICEVIRDEGKVRYDYYAHHAEFHELETGLSQVFRFDRIDRNQMFLDELLHFLACLRGEEDLQVDLVESRRSLEISLAASVSLNNGEGVTLHNG